MAVMRDWAVAITLIGVSVIVTAVILGLCRIMGGWTWIQAWITGSNEETVRLTKSEHRGSNGYMVSSDSDLVLDISGQYKRYDQLGKDIQLAEENRRFEMASAQFPGNVAGLVGPRPGIGPPIPPPPIREDPIPACLPPPPSKSSIVQSEAFRKQKSTDSEGRASPDLVLPETISLDGVPINTGGHRLLRAMSCDSVSSDTSVVLEALESPQHSGEIEIGLEYDNDSEDLIVIINRARDLVGPDPNVVVDSYVRVFLLPDKSTNLQTRLQKKTNDPVFKERFLFGVDRRELVNRSVLCYVYTSDKYTHTVVGEAEVKLGDIDISSGSFMAWFPIVDSNQRITDLGDVMFSLSYLPTAERLTCVVVKARNLKWSDTKEVGDSFVKVYLLQNGKKISKKKTSMKKRENNPIFNEAMIFSVPSHALQNVQVRLTVAEHLTDGKTPAIGHVFVGPHCCGKSLSHWNQMMTSLRKPIAMWHPLRK